MIAVGNESMVQWAIQYFVYPNVILKWVNYLKELRDAGLFDGLTHNGKPITKTYGGDKAAMMAELLPDPLKRDMGLLETFTVHENRKPGEPVTEGAYVVVHPFLIPDGTNDLTYPSAKSKLNAWEGTCTIEMTHDYVIKVATGSGSWWGCALEIQGGLGEDLSAFASQETGTWMVNLSSSETSIILRIESRDEILNRFCVSNAGLPYELHPPLRN